MRASRGLKWENKMYKVKRSIVLKHESSRLPTSLCLSRDARYLRPTGKKSASKNNCLGPQSKVKAQPVVFFMKLPARLNFS